MKAPLCFVLIGEFSLLTHIKYLWYFCRNEACDSEGDERTSKKGKGGERKWEMSQQQ